MRHEPMHKFEDETAAERPVRLAYAAPRRHAAFDLSDLLLLGLAALALVAAIGAQMG